MGTHGLVRVGSSENSDRSMLFLNQIKREFRPLTLKRGQTYFRESRVTDVHLDGNLIAGKVQGTGEAPYECAIQ
ncbi:MAG TPA: hypothetical protein VM598_01170, partial [Bdellovibrionota bacterium]|nr:hypothetical protein [Bdellovibrionota bacterium]